MDAAQAPAQNHPKPPVTAPDMEALVVIRFLLQHLNNGIGVGFAG